MAFYLPLLTVPISIGMALGYRRKWAISLKLQKKRWLYRILIGVQMLIYLFPIVLIAATPFLDAQVRREDAEREARDHKVLSEPMMIYGIEAPAGSRVSLSYWSDDWHYPLRVRYSRPVVWQGLHLTEFHWNDRELEGFFGLDAIALAKDGEIDGWLCRHDTPVGLVRQARPDDVVVTVEEAWIPYFDASLQPELDNCILAIAYDIGGESLPAGTRIRRSPISACRESNCGDSKPQPSWLAELPVSDAGVIWQGERWAQLTLQIGADRHSYFLYRGQR
ncbi:hypothetical protein [Jeongeupia naejangsanensis]|uniref:Uncharacterized protein n=1 Tax=Jeongeupia naejangsanensis TaxID=613195 RepID=A0ABS2BJJ7_9NEIS|nr:hypothetical protein [Jeongeupia naejangsanensis]MBM3115786.1 hypothetical protein [Jeongeupia naejangsanensis]